MTDNRAAWQIDFDEIGKLSQAAREMKETFEHIAESDALTQLEKNAVRSSGYSMESVVRNTIEVMESMLFRYAPKELKEAKEKEANGK